MESAQDRADYPRYLLRLCELERIDRERRNIERRIRAARFPQTKSLDTFDFTAQPSLNKSAGSRTGALRMDRDATELHRARAIRHRQNPYRPGIGAGRLSEKTEASPSPRPPPSCMNSWKRATNVAYGHCKSTSTWSSC